MKLLLISSVTPQDTTATELVLHRHFAAAVGELEVTIASDHPALTNDPNGIPIIPNPILLRLTKTRLAAIAHSLRQLLPTHDTRALYHNLCQHRPDAILTVAHGTLYPVALRMSKRFGLPLVSIFHDWFPDMARFPALLRPWLDRQFRHLYQRSNLVFCVSEGMRQMLGDHPNVRVLLPIPGEKLLLSQKISAKAPVPFTVAYAGNLSTCYAPMLQALGQLTKTTESLQLRLFGPVPHWSPEMLHDLTEADIYGGFLSREALLHELYQASVLLVVMSFEASDRRRMETSFPSKLIEFCSIGKPLVIWGPSYCTAIQWARKHMSAITITNPNPQVLLNALETISKAPEEYTFYAQQARKMAQSMFDPSTIQQQFMDALMCQAFES
ncbi:glycosyltransferase [Vacuolonema iberomarrocanum]|uniref:glycosyltransferase n=1 Tax=Vacuolonema iberomarrocanum TaxID=3454632 RepID=UPI001A0D3E76|nr:glycosyltransferase [filamentous cyanobacterium LEGE 07170]